MKLFTLKGDSVEICTTEVLLFEELRILWERDKSKNKSQVFKEFNFIYQSCDPKSSPNKDGYSGDELEEKARDIARLPEGWKPDIEVRNAMMLYVSVVPSISAKLLQEILISMNFSVTILKKLRTQVSKKLNQNELTPDELTTLETALDKILSVAASFTKNMKTLRDTEELIIAEESKDIVKRRGGSEVEDSMNPETSM